MVAIGERIKELRKENKITQQELADELNVSRSAVSNWEVGRNYPDVELIVQLSYVLEISLDNLLKEDTIMVKEISEEQRRGTIRKKVLKIIIPLFIISLFTIGYLLYQEVDAVHNTFSPNIDTIVNLEEEEPFWTPVVLEEEPFLNMEGLFWDKEIVNSGASASDIEIRISDADTKENVYQFTLEAGKKHSLNTLNKNTNYLIEVRGDNGVYFLKFL